MREVSFSVRDLPPGVLSTSLLDTERVVGVSLVDGSLSLLVEVVTADDGKDTSPIVEFIENLDGEWLDRMVDAELQTDPQNRSYGQLVADVLRGVLLQ